MVKLSVIITTYNSEKTIQRLLNSIQNQEGNGDFFTLEVIIVDDCSTDNTLSILKENGIHYHTTSVNSKGPNKGRNIGLALATGDYFCITDHDDEWKLDRIKKTLPYFNKFSIITSGYTVIDSVRKTEAHTISDYKTETGYVHFLKNETFKNLLSRNGVGQNVYLGSIFLEKSLKEICFEEVFGLVDFDWILNIFHNSESIEIKDSLYYRHIKEDNLSLNGHFRICDFHYSLITIEKYFDEYPVLVKKSYKKIHENIARFYYLQGQMSKARFYFLKSNFSKKTFVLFVTSFIGSDYIRKKYRILG